MTPIPYDDALALVRQAAARRPLPIETVPLVLARGRVLAEAIVAGESIPSAPNSAMDGYALRADETTGATAETPVHLRVIGESAAGSPFNGTIGSGEAVRIMTGGLLPEGADGVVEVEATSEEDGLVAIERRIAPGNSVRGIGEDVREGERLLTPGRRLTPGDIGLLASLGVVNVPVRVRPIVGLLATGDELVEPHRLPGHGEIRNSTAPALFAACAEAGAEPIDLGIARDDGEELAEKIEEGLRYDLLVTTGGVSAGRYDHVRSILPDLGVQTVFHGVRIRPGKPVLFGTFGVGGTETLVFALPGNPVSTMVTFRLFVLPALRELLGEDYAPLRLRARLDGNSIRRSGFQQFIRGVIVGNQGGRLVVTTTGTQSSGALSSMSRADCLIDIPPGEEIVASGDDVTIELLRQP